MLLAFCKIQKATNPVLGWWEKKHCRTVASRLVYLPKYRSNNFTRKHVGFFFFTYIFALKIYICGASPYAQPPRPCFLYVRSRADNLSGAKSNHLFPLIHPDRMRDPRNNSQFSLKIPVQLRVIWFLCSPEIYMYSAYQLDYWQVGRITQFEVTCFSVCSIQCHIALEEEAYCSVEWMRNFLVPPFPAAHSCACSFFLFFFLHYTTTWNNKVLKCKCTAIR